MQLWDTHDCGISIPCIKSEGLSCKTWAKSIDQSIFRSVSVFWEKRRLSRTGFTLILWNALGLVFKSLCLLTYIGNILEDKRKYFYTATQKLSCRFYKVDNSQNGFGAEKRFNLQCYLQVKLIDALDIRSSTIQLTFPSFTFVCPGLLVAYF